MATAASVKRSPAGESVTPSLSSRIQRNSGASSSEPRTRPIDRRVPARASRRDRSARRPGSDRPAADKSPRTRTSSCHPRARAPGPVPADADRGARQTGAPTPDLGQVIRCADLLQHPQDATRPGPRHVVKPRRRHSQKPIDDDGARPRPLPAWQRSNVTPIRVVTACRQRLCGGRLSVRRTSFSLAGAGDRGSVSTEVRGGETKAPAECSIGPQGSPRAIEPGVMWFSAWPAGFGSRLWGSRRLCLRLCCWWAAGRRAGPGRPSRASLGLQPASVTLVEWCSPQSCHDARPRCEGVADNRQGSMGGPPTGSLSTCSGARSSSAAAPASTS